MKSIQLDLLEKLRAEYVPNVAPRKWDEDQVIYQTSISPTGDILSRQRDASQAQTEQSSSQLDFATKESTFGFSSKPTTGQPSYTESVILSGQAETALSALSGRPYPKLGPSIPPDCRLPTDATDRKRVPLWSGLLAYFPDALVEIAAVSYQGSKQHHPDKPLHWDKTKSTDHHDCLLRHLLDGGTYDKDGMRHSAKVAWRALAMLQLEIEGSK